MMRFLARALLLAATIALASCASPGGRLVSAGSGVAVFELQLDTSLDWARIKRARIELWTIDGLPLNEFVVVSRVRPGEHVFLAARERQRRPDGPWYRQGMRPDEIRDVILDGLRQQGWANVSASNLRPARFGSVTGLRFDARLTHRNGLLYQATFAAAEHGGRLTHFFWIAPSEYYYGRDIAAVDRMLDSARFVD
ncbi:MAG: hypothetical protein WC213_04840 [Arenimonas sp.]|jgi:hypothetical protein